jgi:hypothetical protein
MPALACGIAGVNATLSRLHGLRRLRLEIGAESSDNFVSAAAYRKAYQAWEAPEADFDIQALHGLPHLQSLELQGKLMPSHSWRPEHWRAVASCKQLRNLSLPQAECDAECWALLMRQLQQLEQAQLGGLTYAGAPPQRRLQQLQLGYLLVQSDQPQGEALAGSLARSLPGLEVRAR